MQDDYNCLTDDFLNIFKNKNKYNFNDIIKKIIYNDIPSWILKQYFINEKYENIKEIIDINVKDLLSNLQKIDTIIFIINKLKNKYLNFKSINKNIGLIFLISFFKNINKQYLKKIVKICIFKDKYTEQIINVLKEIFVLVDSNIEFLEPFIIEFNNFTKQNIKDMSIVESYKIYNNNNNIIKKLFNINLKCINIIFNNIKNYIISNKKIYIENDIKNILSNIFYNFNNHKDLLNTFEYYLLNLYKNINNDMIFKDGKLLKNILQLLNYIYHLNDIENIINLPLIIKTNINSIFHNDDILKYFIFGLSKIIIKSIDNNIIFDIIKNILSLLKFIKNIDIVLQYYYECLQLRIKYYLIENINLENFLNIENKIIQFLELINFSKLQISNNIYNCIENFKKSINFKNKIDVKYSIFINTKLTTNILYKINIPNIFINNIDIIKNKYKTIFNIDNRELELSLKESIVKLSINNITITGSILPMSMLYYYGSSETIDIYSIMFNNENIDIMNKLLNILKQNNLIINNKLNIPKDNIILNENLIENNTIIERITYDRNIITKCYIIKTVKKLRKDIKTNKLFNHTKESIKYFELEIDLFDKILKECIDKNLINVDDNGLIEF